MLAGAGRRRRAPVRPRLVEQPVRHERASGDRFRNDEPYHPYYGYGRSKMEAELAVADAVDSGLDAVMVRPPWFYGPHQPPRQTTFFTMVRNGRVPRVRRRRAGAFDGVRRQPRPGCRARRTDADRRRGAAGGSPMPSRTRSTRSSRRSAGRSATRGTRCARTGRTAPGRRRRLAERGGRRHPAHRALPPADPRAR